MNALLCRVPRALARCPHRFAARLQEIAERNSPCCACARVAAVRRGRQPFGVHKSRRTDQDGRRVLECGLTMAGQGSERSASTDGPGRRSGGQRAGDCALADPCARRTGVRPRGVSSREQGLGEPCRDAFGVGNSLRHLCGRSLIPRIVNHGGDRGGDVGGIGVCREDAARPYRFDPVGVEALLAPLRQAQQRNGMASAAMMVLRPPWLMTRDAWGSTAACGR